MADLDGVDLKLARARHHVTDLTTQVDYALASSGYKLSKDVEQGPPPRVLYKVSGMPVVRPEWSAIVGDILTNLRAALDHLAWQLVILDGQVPGRLTSFPLVDTPTNNKGNSRTEVWPGLRRADLRMAVERVQPYHHGNGHDNALWWLGELCNADKHRELLVVSLFPNLGDIWWGSNPGDTPAHLSFNPKPAKDGDWVLRFDFRGQDPPPAFDPHVGSLVIVLDEGPGMLRTSAIQNTMANMAFLVEDSIVNWEFRKFFA